MNAQSADFAATTPWSGITNKPATFPSDPSQLAPAGATNQSLLIWSAARRKWVPITPGDLMALLQTFLRLTPDSVGLGNVDNTSDAQKNAAVATLTHKTILGAIIRDTLSLGILSPTGFNLFLATSSLLTADRTLELLLDDQDRSIELRASLTLTGDDMLTISVNGAPRLVDLEGDLTLRGGNLVVGLSDGTGSGEDRTLTLTDDLTLAGNNPLTVTANGGARAITLDGDLSLASSLTTAGAFAATFTFTGTTGVTFPTSGTLATTAYVDAGDTATLAAAQVYADNGDTATLAAANAVSATKQPLTGNSFAVAGLPAANANVGRVVYCTNGSAGAPCAAISDGTNWKVIAIGATVSP